MGRKRGRETLMCERYINQLPLNMSPTGDLAHNPGMCSDSELNRRPFGSQVSTQSTEPHQPGQKATIPCWSILSLMSTHLIPFPQGYIKSLHVHVLYLHKACPPVVLPWSTWGLVVTRSADREFTGCQRKVLTCSPAFFRLMQCPFSLLALCPFSLLALCPFDTPLHTLGPASPYSCPRALPSKFKLPWIFTIFP